MLKKERVRSKVIPRKVGVGLKRRVELIGRKWCWKIIFMGIHREGGFIFIWIRRKTPVLIPVLQSNQSSLCSLHNNRDRRPEGQVISIPRTLTEISSKAGRSLKEREKNRVKYGSLRNISTDSKGATFMIFKNHATAPVRKERLSPTSKERGGGGSRNEYMKKTEMPNRIKRLRKINRSKNHWRARLGFVQPIYNRLRKLMNLINSKPTRAQTGLERIENGVKAQERKIKNIE